jgi:hypothetical protein
MRRPPAILAVLSALLLLTTCSGDDEDGSTSVPAGFTRVEASGFTLDHPRDFRRRSTADDPAPSLLYLTKEIAGPARSVIRVAMSEANEFDVEGFIGANYDLQQGLEYADFERDTRKVSVPGAEEAQRVELAYTDDRSADQPFKVRLWAVVAQKANRDLCTLEVGSSVDGFDEETFTAVLESFRLT